MQFGYFGICVTVGHALILWAMVIATPLPLPGIQRIAVCGLGLIGGSAVRALRARGFAGRITGMDVDAALLQALHHDGWIDDIAHATHDLFAQHDLVLLCQPVEPLLAFVEQHGARMAEGRAVGMDVASVKGPVVQALRQAHPEAARRFVPSHPIAGKAQHGWAAGDGALFSGKRCVLTPTEAAEPQALQTAQAFWELLGARVSSMDAEQHDTVYAAISHMPQLLSYAYLHSLAQRNDARQWLAYQGTGYQGFTRLGSSDPALWAGIMAHNQHPLVTEIDRLQDALGLIRQQLQGDHQALQATFEEARAFHAMGVTARDAAAPVSPTPQPPQEFP
ncbi:MAG: prephenate dehydrogenase, partial [Acidovorax sp.]